MKQEMQIPKKEYAEGSAAGLGQEKEEWRGSGFSAGLVGGATG